MAIRPIPPAHDEARREATAGVAPDDGARAPVSRAPGAHRGASRAPAHPPRAWTRRAWRALEHRSVRAALLFAGAVGVLALAMRAVGAYATSDAARARYAAMHAQVRREVDGQRERDALWARASAEWAAQARTTAGAPRGTAADAATPPGADGGRGVTRPPGEARTAAPPAPRLTPVVRAGRPPRPAPAAPPWRRWGLLLLVWLAAGAWWLAGRWQPGAARASRVAVHRRGAETEVPGTS